MDTRTCECLVKTLHGPVEENAPLAPLTTIRIGGPARLLYRARTANQLVDAIETAYQCGAPFWLLGGGSNLVISDRGLDGLAVVDETREHLDFSGGSLRVSSGYLLQDIVQACREKSFTGFEFAAGIPGNLGGAVCGNAGAYGCTIGDRLLEAEVWTPGGQIRRVPAEFFQFEYRESVFKKTQGIVLSATFKIEPGEPDRINRRMDENLKRRWERLPPPDLPSAGSFFKNLQPEKPGQRRQAAGLFLERAGVKGMRFGKARVFDKHANIIVNTGGATAQDVYHLAQRMKGLVLEKFGIALQEEARYLGQVP